MENQVGNCLKSLNFSPKQINLQMANKSVEEALTDIETKQTHDDIPEKF